MRTNDIVLRVFLLVKPPFLDETEALHGAKRIGFDRASIISSCAKPSRPAWWISTKWR